MTLPERFWAKVDKTDGCWMWVGALTSAGYGSFRLGGRAEPASSAHVLAWEDVNGTVPMGLTLDHVVCGNRACCRPDHMEPVTRVENVMRGCSPPAVNARKSMCDRGHPLTPRRDRPDRRECRLCRLDAQRRRRACKKESVLC